jgi:DUF2924 family protein
MKRTISDAKSEQLAQELKDLETRGDDELKERWRSLYGTQPPQKIHRSLLIAAVAHRLQENALGALKPSLRRHLMQVANHPATPRPSLHYPSLRPSAGTVLVRDWGAVTHQAEVLEEGILFRSKRYNSLSEVARIITARAGRDRGSSASNPPPLRSKIMEPAKASSRRCAIYTRKSSDEGLEQDFNSLHAQREACDAFIKSQAGEGWRPLKTAYNFGKPTAVTAMTSKAVKEPEKSGTSLKPSWRRSHFSRHRPFCFSLIIVQMLVTASAYQREQADSSRHTRCATRSR